MARRLFVARQELQALRAWLRAGGGGGDRRGGGGSHGGGGGDWGGRGGGGRGDSGSIWELGPYQQEGPFSYGGAGGGRGGVCPDSPPLLLPLVRFLSCDQPVVVKPREFTQKVSC